MDRKAENVIRNVGAVAEATSVFYNSIAGRVPKDVALVLSQHFMDLIFTRSSPNIATAIAALQALEAQRKKKQEEISPQAPRDSGEEPPQAPPEPSSPPAPDVPEQR